MGTFYDQDREVTVSVPLARSTAHTARQRTALPPQRPCPPPRRTRRRRSQPFRVILPFLALAGTAFVFWSAIGQAKAPARTPDNPGQPYGPTVLQPPSPSNSQSAGNNTEPVSVPDWVVEDLLPVNEYSRPGDALPQVNGVVVHYVGNPGTTAEQNRSYFANLAQTGETWASSHFIIGIDGTVIQCVPLNEIAYCSTVRNADTISIECCHQDEEGQFSPETMDSLIRLLDWLIDTYDLQREDVIRHYDIAGKECPIYYVRHPEAWDGLLDSLNFSEP